MTTFKWEGRDSEGRVRRGRITAGGRRQPSLSARLAQQRRTSAPRPFRGLFLAALFFAAAFGVGALAPVIVFRCDRGADGAAGCSIARRVLGIYPLSRQELAGVEAAEVERQTTTVPYKGGRVDRTETRLVFRGAAGTIRPDDWDAGVIDGSRPRRSRTPEMLAREFAEFLGDPSSTAISRWQISFVPLILAGVLGLLGLLTAGLSVLAFFLRPTEYLYDRVAALAEAADARADEQTRHD